MKDIETNWDMIRQNEGLTLDQVKTKLGEVERLLAVGDSVAASHAVHDIRNRLYDYGLLVPVKAGGK